MRFFGRIHRRGRPPHPDVLTPAEWRVLRHVRDGMPNAEIAVRLGISVNTVRTHVSSMLAKLEVGDRKELAAWQGEPAEASRVAPARRVPVGLPLIGGLRWAQLLALSKLGAATTAFVGLAVAVSIGVAVVRDADEGPQGEPEEFAAVATATASSPAGGPVGQSTTAPRPTPEAAYGERVFVTSDDPAIDEIIAAMRARDADALFAHTSFREWACVGPGEVLLGPSCSEGEEPGTPARGIAVAACSGNIMRPDVVLARYEAQLALEPGLYAAFRGTEILTDLWPGYDAVVLTVVRDPARALDLPWGLIVDEGAIVGIDFGCGASPKQMLDRYRGRRYLVPPPYWRLAGEPIETSPERRSGDPAVDRIIDAVLAGEPLASMMRFESVPCATAVEGIGGPPRCPDGVTDGTPLDVVLTLQCEGGWLTREAAAEFALPTTAELWAVAIGSRLEPDDPDVLTAVFAYPPPENSRPRAGERQGFALWLVDGAIEVIDWGCASRPDRLVPSPAGSTFAGLDFLIVPADERG